MDKNRNKVDPEFSLKLLTPQYWPVWLGFGLLAFFVNLLPYKVLLVVGKKLGRVGMHFGKKRVHIATRNLELSFPDKTDEEINKIVVENFKNTGLALIETGIAWFWPTWRLRRLISTENFEQLDMYQKQGKGVLICFVHALNLEISARAFALVGQQGYGVYRPHTNPAYDFIQFKGRTRNGNKAIDRRDLKKMIKVLRNGERLFYLPDHDYGHNKSVFVPFFAVDETCTTTGPSLLSYPSNCAIITGSGFRNELGGYDLILDDSIHEIYPKKDMTAAARLLNEQLEKVILRGLDQWMWLHKRFKSMPDHSKTNERYL